MKKQDAYAFIPPEFFVKEKAEQAMMDIVQRIVDYRRVRRGNPNLFEPDFVANGDQGIEMTIASFDVQNTTLIQMLKNYDYTPQDAEADAIASILAALGRKSKKHYCLTKIDVVIADILPLRAWYESADSLCDVVGLDRRNALYREIFDRYILTNVFTNVFLIITGGYGEIVVLDVKAHETGGRHIYRLKFESGDFPWPFRVSKKVYERAAEKGLIAGRIKKLPESVSSLRGTRVGRKA